MGDTQYSKMEVAIIGAGGFARELSSWITVGESAFTVKGFYDDNNQALEAYPGAGYVIGNIADFISEKYILIGIMNPEVKNRIMELCAQSSVKILSYIDISARVGIRTKPGIGFVAFPQTVISCDCIIGDNVFINCGSQIGHDVIIGDSTSIMANVDIGGGAIIGKNVFIGSGATILPGVKIANNARIGAGSVVIKNVRESGTYFGNPAKKIF